jgi:hypothetical protein
MCPPLRLTVSRMARFLAMGFRCCFGAFVLCAGLLQLSPKVQAAEIGQLNVERTEDGIYLSASVRFELPIPVEDALIKGIAMFFVVEADISQSRWYWTDRRVASAARTIRLAYQPLTRIWRVNIVNGVVQGASGLRATLNQNYDNLTDALSAVQRLSRWRVADNADVEPDAVYKLDFSYYLDLSQLPRPFQIGVVGQKDWTISAKRNERLQLGAARGLTDRSRMAVPPNKEADK